MAEKKNDSTKIGGIDLASSKKRTTEMERKKLEEMNKPTPTFQRMEGTDKTGKKTVLGDEAFIYQKREEKTEKQKWKEMTKSEKWGYFKDYYMKACVIGLIVLLLAGNLIYTIIKGTPEQMLNIAVLDNIFEAEFVEKITTDMTEEMVTDPEEQEVYVDTEYYFSTDEYNNQMKLMTRVSAGEIDLIIARRDRFLNQASNEAFQDMSILLNDEQKEKFSKYFEMCSIQDVDIDTDEVTYGEPTAFGIHLAQLDDYNGYNLADNPLIIGILANSAHPENAVRFIEYLFEEFE